MDLSSLGVWIVAHPTEAARALVELGAMVSMVTALVPESAQRWPVLGYLVRFCARFGVLTHPDQPGTLKWPGVRAALLEAARDTVPQADAKGSTTSDKGSHGGTVPPLPLLLVLGTVGAFAACASLPPAEGCTPRSTRCSPSGRPQVCSASTRWTNVSETACASVDAVCCAATDPDGHPTHACIPATACAADGGT